MYLPAHCHLRLLLHPCIVCWYCSLHFNAGPNYYYYYSSSWESSGSAAVQAKSQPHRMIVTIIVVSWNLQSFVLCAVLMCSWGELSHQPSMDGKKFNSPNECTERRRSSGEKDRGSLSLGPQSHALKHILQKFWIHAPFCMNALNLCELQLLWMTGLVSHYSRHCFSVEIRATSPSVRQSGRQSVKILGGVRTLLIKLTSQHSALPEHTLRWLRRRRRRSGWVALIIIKRKTV